MTDKNKKQHIGVPISDVLFQSINLYSLAKKIPKTEIIRDSLNQWVSKESLNLTELIQEMASQITNDWLRTKTKIDQDQEEQEFEKHCKKWREELRTKRVSNSVIKKIMIKVKR